jgi:hypothetical protein
MWHHRALEHENHHTPSKLCILGFEPLKQGTKMIDGQRPGFPLWRLQSGPYCRQSIQYSGVALRSSPPPEYLAA